MPKCDFSKVAKHRSAVGIHHWLLLLTEGLIIKNFNFWNNLSSNKLKEDLFFPQSKERIKNIIYISLK